MADLTDFAYDQLIHSELGNVRRENEKGFSDLRFATATGLGDLQKTVVAGDGEIRRDVAQANCQIISDVHDASYKNLAATEAAGAKVIASADNGFNAVTARQFQTSAEINGAASRVASAVEMKGDKLSDQASAYFIANTQSDRDAAREIAAIQKQQDAMASKLAYEIQLNCEKNSTAAMLEVSRNAAAAQLEAAKNTTAIFNGQCSIERSIATEGNETRRLMNQMKYDDLNRALIERNAEVVEWRHDARHWRGLLDQNQFAGQFAAIQSQLQMFGSQLNDTKQSVVNFGTQTGFRQGSTSNNA